MKMKSTGLALSLCLGLVVSSVKADDIVLYTFTGNSLSPASVATFVGANSVSLSAGTIGFGTAQSTTWTNTPNSGVPYADEQDGWTAATQDTAKFFQFTLSNSGANFTITNLSFEARATGAGPSAIGVAINGTNIFSQNMTQDVTQLINIPVSGNDDLASALIAIQGWTNGTRATAGTGNFRIDTILVEGTIDAPVDAPEVIITTADNTVLFDITSIDVEGTANANTVGDLSWTNALTAASGTIAASASWTIPGVGLDVGTNLITVSGTNSTGVSSSDSVTIIRAPAVVTNVQFTTATVTVSEVSAVVTVTVYKTTADGSISGEVALSGTATEIDDFTINTTNFILNGATTSATFEITVVDEVDQEGPETVVLTIVNLVGGTLGSPSAFTLVIAASDFPAPPNGPVWINEIDYDNVGTDSNEYIEIAGPAGTDLSTYSIVLYNGSGGASYSTTNLSGTIDDEGCGYGAVHFIYPVNGIQNGNPDGVALISNDTSVVQFLSYGGTFDAVGGPADGYTSVDIGVIDSNTQIISVQLEGTGNTYADYTWATNALSPGVLNLNQAIFPCGGGDTTLDEYDVDSFTLTPGLVSITVNITSNGVPYSLLYTTNLLTAPVPTGTADTEVATGGPVTLQDASTVEPAKFYWIRTND